MVTAEKKVVYSLENQPKGYVLRALKLLEETDEYKRLMGYCLVYNRFNWLPKDLRYHIIQKWNNENKESKTFTNLKKYLNKKFQ
ncbi:MAG: hypothetical protein K9W46_00585 [Candidatus Heimdallarchaeum endolithica]|uniref:Uncharacterized protein n=1 Tax=Candidatus Heimdallarchaeum endolithica TaxID=2876572 RepID=A0A9Y1BRG7_9ARCH|nr:MAG: hypothetical protein K9W46_00585 [Candidatus Heimdallarchaeum endolithica]